LVKDQLHIRRYRREDHDDVVALHYLALQQVGADGGPGPWDADLDDIENVYLRNRGEFLVGLYRNRLAAMGALRPIDTERGEIKRMRVHPDFQRRGFGEAILRSLEARARELGYRVLQLDTTAQQVGAQAFYRKHGFTEVERVRGRRFELLFFEKPVPLT
jgi:ribosomal protein S18 acetylase RimI-like enzyme